MNQAVRWAKAEAQKFSAQVQQQHKQAYVAGPVIDPKDAEVTEDMFLILLFLAENENRTPDEVAEFLNIGKPLAHHLLESLQSKALVNDKHMPGSAWAGSKYRNEWFCTSAGRSYLASRKVLK